MLGINLVSFSLRYPRLLISSRFLFFNSTSFTTLKPHLAKYEHGNGKSSFLAKLVELWNFVCVSSQSHVIAPFMLNKVLNESLFCILESSSL